MRAPLGLHTCPVCRSELVQPTTFQLVDPGWWHVERICPSCHWSHIGVHGQEAVDQFDHELAIGEAQLLAALDELSRANLQDEVERFARALATDAILPSDF